MKSIEEEHQRNELEDEWLAELIQRKRIEALNYQD
jgi:hypothetical protein